MAEQFADMSWLVGFILLLATFSGLVWKAVTKVIAWKKDVVKKFEDASSQLAYMFKEVRPNSGSTLYDKINNISDEISLVRQDIMIQHHISRQIRDDMISIPYCEFDREGNLIFANKKFQQAVELGEHALEQRGWVSIFPEEFRGNILSRYLKSIVDKTPFQATFECTRCEEPHGIPVKYILSTSQVIGYGQEVIYVTGKIIKA